MGFNRKHTQAEIENLRKKMTGKKHTEETKEKIKDAAKKWAMEHPNEIEERIIRLDNYRQLTKEVMKKYLNGDLIEKN